MDRTDARPVRADRPTASTEARPITVEHRFQRAHVVPVRRAAPIDWAEPGLSEDLSER